MRCPHFQYVHCWIKKVTSHSAKNSIILASSFGRIFWTAWSAVSMSGTCVAEGIPTVRLIFVSKVEPAFGNPLAWFLQSMVILARGHGSGSVDRQCNSVSSGNITWSSPPCGRYCAVGPAVPFSCWDSFWTA